MASEFDDLARRRFEAAAERIDRLNGKTRSLISVLVDTAREDLDISLARPGHGPLKGMTMSVKDNIDTAGVRTTRGSAFFTDRVPNADAPIVARLRQAGAAIIGKDNMHEFAFGGTSQNPHHGLCRNPWNLDAIPGGSSGGSGASTAAGFSQVSLGTDTGGSVRIPAALNGVSGLRPTVGRVSNRGVMPVSAQFDTVGPLARSVADVADVYEVIAGYDALDPYSENRPVEGWRSRFSAGIGGLRVGFLEALTAAESTPHVADLLAAAAKILEGLGALVTKANVENAEANHVAYMTVVQADAAMVHAERMATTPEIFGADVSRRLRLGGAISGQDYSRSQNMRAEWRRHVEGLFDRFDVLILPTVGFGAPLASDQPDMIAATHRLTRLTSIWSFAELPGLSVPCGFENGLPIGLQIIGPKWSEALLLAVGAAYQDVTDFHQQLPPLLD